MKNFARKCLLGFGLSVAFAGSLYADGYVKIDEAQKIFCTGASDFDLKVFITAGADGEGPRVVAKRKNVPFYDGKTSLAVLESFPAHYRYHRADAERRNNSTVVVEIGQQMFEVDDERYFSAINGAVVDRTVTPARFEAIVCAVQ